MEQKKVKFAVVGAGNFGGGRCFGLVANMDFLLVCTYEENGENPQLVLYKKR